MQIWQSAVLIFSFFVEQHLDKIEESVKEQLAASKGGRSQLPALCGIAAQRSENKKKDIMEKMLIRGLLINSFEENEE